MTFTQLELIEPLLKALNDEGYTQPTPIQEQAIPIVLHQHDLLGCAQTGTGKTAAFALPILQLLHKEIDEKNAPHRIKCLVLTPTRELAIQIGESFAAYGRYTKVKHTVIFGGVGQLPQVNAIRSGVDVLIATPGRLLDLYQQKLVNFHHLQLFVLDEADRMLDMGFIHDVKKVISYIPARRQTLFFSATMPPEIAKLASTILSNPEKVAVTPVSSTVESIEQKIFLVDKPNKKKLLLHLLENESIASALVFTRTKHGADKIARELIKDGIVTAAIHGNKGQTARQTALQNFKSRKIRVLIATDIAARGIDVDELTHVINFDLPNVPETYVHRIGRTGRAGLSGTAFSFCDYEELAYLKDIQKLIGRTLEIEDNHPFPLESKETQKQDSPNHYKENVRKHTSTAKHWRENKNRFSNR